MSDNKLLNENTIRRFMKLANVDTMTDSFVNEMYGKSYDRSEDEDKLKKEDTVTEEEVNEEEEEVNEEVDALYEEEEEEEEGEMDMGMDAEEEPEMDEPEADMDEPAMDAEPEMGAADMSLTEEEAQLLIDLGSRLAEAMGGEKGEDDIGGMKDMKDMEDMGDMGDKEEPAPADEEDEEVMQEALVNEVLKRVTKRLVAEKLRK